MMLLYTMGSGSASGHCNTMEMGPKTSSGQKKSNGRRRTSSTLKETGTGRSSLGATTLGTGNFQDTFEFTAKTYTRMVRKTFQTKPGIYKEFVQIMSEVIQTNTNKVELVKRIVVLFEGYPELIKGFSHFLPPEITMEIQEDAVIVNVEDEEESDSDYEEVEREEDTDTVRYIRNIKWTYMHQPEIYDRFNIILQGYNRKSISEIDAVNQIAELFKGQRDLVLGFNIFLPEAFKIIEHESRGFLIRHPCKKGLKAHYTPIDVQVE